MRRFTWRFLLVNILAFVILVYAYTRINKGDFTHLKEKSRLKQKASDLLTEKRNLNKQNLQNIIQNKFKELQNPENCENARKLVCKVRTLCGVGCELHHLGTCMFIALGTNRTLITDVQWLESWFSEIFEPISSRCRHIRREIVHKNYPEWKAGETTDIKVVQIWVEMAVNHFTDFAPGSVPSSLLPVIQTFNNDPVVWWIGQVMAYICRFTPSFQQEVEIFQKSLGLDSDDVIVGLHIRRSDKVLMREASYKTNDWYMERVIEWFDKRESKTEEKIHRRVYLATDDLWAVGRLRKSYPDYTFICDANVQKDATILKRISRAGVRGLMLDVYALAKCDFVVCTFSSNVGRLVYELMQFYKTDPSDDIVSLDFRYDYPIPHPRLINGTLDHRAENLNHKYDKTLDPFGKIYPNFENIL